MESHVLNTYHRARYGLHARVSSSSESSCTQTSPEYPAVEPWSAADETKSSIKVEEDSSVSSSDGEYVLPYQTYAEIKRSDAFKEPSDMGPEHFTQEEVVESDDDYEVVVDDEHVNEEPLIQVYAVDPNLDFDASDDEEVMDTGLSLDLEKPVVTNVDEYFIKESKNIEVKDNVVNKEVEYFIKQNADEQMHVAVDEFFEKETPYHKPVTPTVETTKLPEFKVGPESISTIKSEPESIDPDVIPHIEQIKRFLLEDMPCDKLQSKTVQRSCSLPHSPAHFSYLDVDDARTSLSYEDLNLDLADFSFDDGKNKTADSSDETPRTLTEEDVNSFLITVKIEPVKGDDFRQQDMEFESPVESKLPSVESIEPTAFSPLSPVKLPHIVKDEPKMINVLDFCVEKTEQKPSDVSEVKDADDFVDVESLNDAAMPLLEATNVSSLLEQFEATEKLNKVSKKGKRVLKGLANGTRLQDAAAQLNRNKMRQLLMPPGAVAKSHSGTVHSDHDYCSPKKRAPTSALKPAGGRSLLRPDVLSSNNRILNARPRSCKNKNLLLTIGAEDTPTNNAAKPNAKHPLNSNHRKKMREHDKSNISVISNKASKASDNCSQSSSGSIKLTIKNKSKVILKLDCDGIKEVKDDTSSVKEEVKHVKIIKPLDDSFNKSIHNSIADTNLVVHETRPIKEDFYTALFNDKQGIQITLPEPLISVDKKAEEKFKVEPEVVATDTKPMKKKLNLQEYKMRREGVNSNANSRTVSPEAIFPEIHIKTEKVITKTEMHSPTEIIQVKTEVVRAPSEVFDPIKEASRKILMNTKKHKAEAMRKRDEDMVMRKIPKVENLELQPLISDAEMMKIAGMMPEILPQVIEKPKLNADYVEIVLLSVGTNTDESIFKELQTSMNNEMRTLKSPTHDKGIHFKIGKKGDGSVLRQNVFEPIKKERSPDDRRITSPKKDQKIDTERFKDITATIKIVEKQVDKKISSNSLFASIQDVVMKKAPENDKKLTEKNEDIKKSADKSPVKKKAPFFKTIPSKTKIIRDFDTRIEHGEDKIILHLEKNRKKPKANNINIQTDAVPELSEITTEMENKISEEVSNKSSESEMSVFSSEIPNKENKITEQTKKSRSIEKSRSLERNRTRSRSKDARSKSKDLPRSRSKDLYDRYSRRSRSVSRSRSRPIENHRRNRRSVTLLSKRSRSPYRKRICRSRSRSNVKRSPVKKREEECTPSLRKKTVSESSDSSSSCSSSSSDSSRSRSHSRSRSRSRSRRSASPPYRKPYRSYSSDGSKPVEERRIVFVGKLENDMTKSGLHNVFSKFGPIIEVTLHNKDNGYRYGFVTFRCGRDAWAAVAASASFANYDVGFGGRRAFCRQRYEDLDGLEAEYSEGYVAPPARRGMSFEQMLQDVKNKLHQRKKPGDAS